ncbi:MAG: hypothetical protein MJ007_03155 [Paludibacteraceae bacterium]|nr:hypothetical protein [Paludibacteraceae bacterium]
MTNLEEEIMWELKSQAMLKRLKSRVQRRKRIRTFWIGVSSLAACLAFICVFSWNSEKNRMYNISSIAIENLEVETVRGDVDLMRINLYRSMLKQDGETLNQVNDSLSNFIDELSHRTYSDDLVGYYFREVDTEHIEDAEYMQALCAMRRGDVWKARDMLRKIKNGGGMYAADADRLLRMREKTN